MFKIKNEIINEDIKTILKNTNILVKNTNILIETIIKHYFEGYNDASESKIRSNFQEDDLFEKYYRLGWKDAINDLGLTRYHIEEFEVIF